MITVKIHFNILMLVTPVPLSMLFLNSPATPSVSMVDLSTSS